MREEGPADVKKKKKERGQTVLSPHASLCIYLAKYLKELSIISSLSIYRIIISCLSTNLHNAAIYLIPITLEIPKIASTTAGLFCDTICSLT